MQTIKEILSTDIPEFIKLKVKNIIEVRHDFSNKHDEWDKWVFCGKTIEKTRRLPNFVQFPETRDLILDYMVRYYRHASKPNSVLVVGYHDVFGAALVLNLYVTQK